MGRLLRAMPAIVLLVSAMLAGGPAQAAPDCNTDVTLTMAASAVLSPPAGTYQVQYQLEVLNGGPCRPSSVTVVDDFSLLSTGYSYAITASTPTSWSCNTENLASFTCVLPGAKIGIADERYAALTVIVTWQSESAPASTTNRASVSTPYPDPNEIDNTAYGALVNATSSLVTEPLTNGRSQQQKISSPPGQTLTAQLRFGSEACETVFPGHGCFGDLVQIDIAEAIEGYMVLTFLYTADVTPAGSTLNRLGILHLYEGIAYSLEACPSRGPIPPYGCIAQKDRLSDVAFRTTANPRGYYYIFTVWTPSNNDWAGDS